MNKILTGSVAGAAGIVLLLGGAGTFALWNDTVAIAGATITAGTLTVEAEEGAWADQDDDAIASIDDYLIVPGDTLTYETVLNVDAEGDNIQAQIVIDHGSIISDDVEADLALEELLTKATTVEVVDGGGVGASVGVGRTGFDLVAGEHELLVTVTIAFPENAADDDDAKTGSVYLSGLAVILSQTL
ncbi:alternate-type signal peptide domain-containing protein [Cryobacterium sp. Y62]|uniref:alternate-type signal peptide domain-containing protein n=2 Tax=unclassified Cryobacterium TaxID=2649013 RepID=UPI000CE4564B|nr:alternate-type signal peptide domain-containing protein [Cryobacterium sp. Y62]